MELTPRKYLDPSWLKKHEQYDDSFFVVKGRRVYCCIGILILICMGYGGMRGGDRSYGFILDFFIFTPPPHPHDTDF